MAGANAPAVFLGLGLRLRAQQGQLEAHFGPRSSPAYCESPWCIDSAAATSFGRLVNGSQANREPSPAAVGPVF